MFHTFIYDLWNPDKTTFNVLAYIKLHLFSRSRSIVALTEGYIRRCYLLLSWTLPSNIFVRRLQHSILISLIVGTGFLCMLHTYNFTTIAKTWLPFWVCRMHYAITKVNHSFYGVTYVCVYLFISCHGPLYSNTSLAGRDVTIFVVVVHLGDVGWGTIGCYPDGGPKATVGRKFVSCL